MKSLLSRAKGRISDLTHIPSSAAQDLPPSHPSFLTAPIPQDIFRYRSHYGTNLGSIFVLERWLFPSLFCGVGESELSAATASIESIGLDATRKKWEQHWASALTDVDLKWLVYEAKCTSIRLPIGYFTLGRHFCFGTPFEDVAKIYKRIWAAVQNLVQRAAEAGIGVLLDLHALPGAANRDAHSGTDSGHAGLWEHGPAGRKYRELATEAVIWVVREASHMKGVLGVQIVNEAVYGAYGLHEWYDDVLEAVGRIDPTVPIYISDAWDLDGTLQWLEGRKSIKANPVVVDTHVYHTFSEADRMKMPEQIISDIPSELSEIDRHAGSVVDRGATQVVVGEYSCVMDKQTWARSDPSQRDTLVQQFGQIQTCQWQQKTGGSFFWTLKMDWMDGGEWGFVEQVKKGAICPPAWLRLKSYEVQERADLAESQKAEIAEQAVLCHTDHWNRTAPGKKFEHRWYGEAWQVGWEDAKAFWFCRMNGMMGEMAREAGGAERIGCLEIWVEKRLRESGKVGEFCWQWEHGFRAGVRAFEGLVGIRLIALKGDRSLPAR